MTRFILPILLCSFQSFAQQDVLSTFFRDTYCQFNPAVYGVEYKHKAAAVYRNQWDKVNGAPNSIFANYGMRLGENHGLGVDYLYDKIGFSDQHQAHLNYNYQFKFAEEHKLAVGVGLGVFNMTTKAVWITPTFTTDPYLNENSNETVPDINFGLYYRMKNLSIGLNSTHVINFEIQTKSGYTYQNARHYYLFASYLFKIGQDFQIQPRMLVRTDAVKMSIDAQVQATYKEKYWAGVGYRVSDAISVMIGWDIKERYRIGYAYDITISKLSKVSRGSHEITLGFLLK